jgi:hypothetical protein
VWLVISCGRVSTPGERRTAHFRAHERRFVQAQASIWHPGRVEQTPAQILNVGLGGAAIACSAVLRLEDRVMITLLSPTLLDALVLAARVAWVQSPQRPGFSYAGLAFEAPGREALLTLFQLIGTLTV